MLICMIIGSISAIVILDFSFKISIDIGLIVGVTNVIPYFGPIIGAVPAVIIAATSICQTGHHYG